VIDDYAKAMELMRKMEAHLPIPAHVTAVCRRALRERGAKIAPDQELQIKHVFYLGDEGGIACDITPSSDAKEVYIVSLTHLRVPNGHPLAQEIRTYQRERARRIARSGGSIGVSRLTMRRLKRRKKRRRPKRR